LSDCLKELSIGVHQHAMYPSGHPSLEPAARRVTERVTLLLKERTTLSLGAAKDQLVIEGVATDSHNPLLKELAGLLHRHHLGAISFHRGVTPDEIKRFMILVAEEPDRTGDPLGLGPPERRDQLTNVRLHPVAYDSLRLVEDDGSARHDDHATRAARTRYAQLWVGLATAAVVRADVGELDENPKEISHDPRAVAEAISEHSDGDAYDQVIVGYILQIADEVKGATGPEVTQLNLRMAEMISAIQPEALARLLEMGGDAGQRREFLMNSSKGLKADSVLRLVEAASESEDQKVSPHMLRLLKKIARQADSATGERGREAQDAVQEQVSDLLTGWALTDPNPQGYTVALREMSEAGCAFVALEDERVKAEPRRIVDMALEMDLIGGSVGAAVDELINNEDTSWVLERIAENKSSSVTRSLIGGTEEFALLLGRLLESEEVNLSLLRMLAELGGATGVGPMMQAVINVPSRQVRRVLLDRLVLLEPDVTFLAMQHLDDPRWFVTRNMLWLLNGVGVLPDDFVADRYLSHEDHRVRYEAVRLGTRLQHGRAKAITRGLTDEHEKTRRLALNAAAEDCPDSALPLVISQASSGPTDLRVLAIKVLGVVGGEDPIFSLLKLTEPERRTFRWKHPPKSPAYLAALRALGSHTNNARARKVLDLASLRRDPEIVAAAQHEGASNV
jgi:hypothetical protein